MITPSRSCFSYPCQEYSSINRSFACATDWLTFSFYSISFSHSFNTRRPRRTRHVPAMARLSAVIRTSGLFLLLFLTTNAHTNSPPWIFSVVINDKSCTGTTCDYEVILNGINVNQWSLTFVPAERGGDCRANEFVVNSFDLSSGFRVPNTERKLYFCASSGNGWLHQGTTLYLEPTDDVSLQTVFAMP